MEAAAASTDRKRDALAIRIDRLIGIRADDETLRADLLDTAMLRPLGLVTASLGFLMMSAVTLWTVGTRWAALWLAVDILLLLVRLALAIRPWRKRQRVSEWTARAILTAATIMFVIFGLGCSASFLTGVPELQVAAAVAIMGLLTGLATRWAGLPRLAAAMVLAVSLPMGLAIATRLPLAAALFGVLAAGTIVLTMQNNRTLVAMLRAEREARRLATRDPLTGLLNRSGFEAALEAHRDRSVTLLYLDLDGFKSVNDLHGHAAGDAVLTEVGARLRSAAGAAPVARLGGDEFVMIRPGDDPAAAAAIMDVLRHAIERPIAIDSEGACVRVGVSCGAASGSLAMREAGSLLFEADEALYRAKRASALHRRSPPIRARAA